MSDSKFELEALPSSSCFRVTYDVPAILAAGFDTFLLGVLAGAVCTNVMGISVGYVTMLCAALHCCVKLTIFSFTRKVLFKLRGVAVCRAVSKYSDRYMLGRIRKFSLTRHEL